MAGGQRTNKLLIPQARASMDRFKQEVATELGIQNYQGYLGDLPSKINGSVGGLMVKKMIAAYENSLSQQQQQAGGLGGQDVELGAAQNVTGAISGPVPTQNNVSGQKLNLNAQQFDAQSTGMLGAQQGMTQGLQQQGFQGGLQQ